MRRILVCVCVALVATVMPVGQARAAGNEYTGLLVITVGWGSAATPVTMTYRLYSPQYPCPSGNPVRFQFDETVVSDGTPLSASCSATSQYTIPVGTKCGDHTFSAAVHNPGDTTGATDTAPASILFTVDCPTPTPPPPPPPAPTPTPSATHKAAAVAVTPQVKPVTSSSKPSPADLAAERHSHPSSSPSQRATAASSAPTSTALADSTSPTQHMTAVSLANDRGISPAPWIAGVIALLVATTVVGAVLRQRRRT